MRLVRSPVVGYVAAVVLPIGATLLVASLGAPAFVFEHLIILLAVAVAMIWGLGPAVTAVIGTFNDNLLLREPLGHPAITAVRDVLDLILFITVAISVAWLVARARREKACAESAREEQDRLVATISHDLATPLMAIRGTVKFATRCAS